MIGRTLSHYEITAKLGEGGMGEVWRATDASLNREVAIKLLPAELAADPERLERFKREAQAIAALNHPNIVTIHSVEEADGVHLLAMELVEGRSLDELLPTDGFELEQLFPLAIQIAAALAAAHEKGIVHRDLKPANVMVTDDGRVKVLDFGLAKLAESETEDEATQLMTQAGMVLGTVPYMSPEQVQAQPVDHRSDVFSFGAVLYEMACGQRPFQGDNAASVISAVLKEQPVPVAQVKLDLPRHLGRIVRRCLEKQPQRRYQSAHDIGLELEGLESELRVGLDKATLDSSSSAPGVALTEPTRTRSWPRLALGATAIALAALALGVSLGRGFRPRTQGESEVLRLDLTAPGHGGTNNRVLSIAPDGSAIVLSSSRGLWLRQMSDRKARWLTGFPEFREPTFSPDGQEVAFWSAGHLNRITVDGSAPAPVGPSIGRPVGIGWGGDGAIYVGQGRDGVWRVQPDGGEPEQVATVEDGQLAHGPDLLPGGEWLVFSVSESMSRWDEAAIVAHSLRTGERHVLVDGGREPRYAASGHLLFVRDNVLYAAPLRLGSIPTAGPAVALESSIRTATLDNTGAAYYDISDSGTLVHITGEDRARAGLAWVAEDGTEEQLPIEPRVFGAIRLSSDQRRLVAEVADPVIGDQVYLFDVDRPNGTRLSVEGSNRNPVWSPEDEYVYFASDAAGDLDIYRRRVDMSSGPELVHAAPGDQIPAAIFPDGSGMVFVESSPSNNDIWRLDFAEAATPQPLAVTDDDERLPALSSDGGLLAYTAFESGDWVVIVREMATGRRHQVGAGWAPVWSRNGSRLFFSNREDVIVRVEVTRRSPFEWGAVTRIAGLVDARNLDVGTDGKRILVPRPVDGEVRDDSIAVTLNWFGELRSRVPPGRD